MERSLRAPRSSIAKPAISPSSLIHRLRCRRFSTMVPCDAPCWPPSLPTWSNLSGVHLPSLLYQLPPPPLYPPLFPRLCSANIGNLSTAMSNFSDKKSSGCGDYPNDALLPDDLYPDDDTDDIQEQFGAHLIGTSLYLSLGKKTPSVIPKLDLSNCPKEASLLDDLYFDDSQGQVIRSLIDEVLCNSSEKIDLNKDSYHKGCNSKFNSFYLEPPKGKSSLTSDLSAKQDVSAQELPQPYGKTNFKFSLDEDFVADYLIESVGDNFSPDPNVDQDIHGDDFAQSFSQTPKQNPPLENVLITAEKEEDCNPKSYSEKQFNADFEQVNSPLSAEISQLKTLVENLTHQVQDMSDKLACQKKLSAPYVDETAQDALFCRAEDKRQKPYESFASISDWGAPIADQSVIIAIATDYFPSRIIPTSTAYELNQSTSGYQSANASAINGKTKSAAGQNANSVGSKIPKNKYIFSRVSFLSGAFNKVRRAATNVGSKMKMKHN